MKEKFAPKKEDILKAIEKTSKWILESAKFPHPDPPIFVSPNMFDSLVKLGYAKRLKKDK